MLIYFEASIFGNGPSQRITSFWAVKLQLQKHKQFFSLSACGGTQSPGWKWATVNLIKTATWQM